jgi:hypothetical protein
MSRDCTLYLDKDGTAYFISASRDNADMHVYRLTEDFLQIDSLVNVLWPGQHREAPAVFFKDGLYYMLTSGCTGWKPNQGKYSVAEKINGQWSPLRDFGDGTTYDSQPTYVLTLERPEGASYLYIGDRWNAESYHDSTYVMMPLSFPTRGEVVLEKP